MIEHTAKEVQSKDFWHQWSEETVLTGVSWKTHSYEGVDISVHILKMRRPLNWCLGWTHNCGINEDDVVIRTIEELLILDYEVAKECVHNDGENRITSRNDEFCCDHVRARSGTQK